MEVDSNRQDNIRDMIDELCNLESGLTDWELNFIEDLCNWDGRFTTKQADALERIYDRLC
jgi:hypothetical protein